MQEVWKEEAAPVESEPQPQIAEIKKNLLDPRVIAAKHDREGEATVASEAARKEEEIRLLGDKAIGRKELLSQIESQAATLNALKAEKLLAIEEKMRSAIVRFKGVFGVRDAGIQGLESEMSQINAELNNLVAQTEQVRGELMRLEREQKDIPEPGKLLEAYYASMETLPLPTAEKREFLTPEILSELDTEEYIALWRRLNPQFISHVTRQGFRDHNAMFEHSGGLQEFHSGLTETLADSKLLRPPMAVHTGLRSRGEASVKKFLDEYVLKAENEEEAKRRLGDQLNRTIATAPHYPDKIAVHFAAQMVADQFYGGEKNNEVFFVYPSDFIASQHEYAFNGWEKDFTKPQSETKWNDVFVWPSTLENPGISVDTGLVFLPDHTPVDPETGSKYASEVRVVDGESKKVLVENEKLIASFVGWATNLTPESPILKAYQDYRDDREYWTRGQRERALTEGMKQEMLQLGFSEEAAAELTHELFSNDQMGAFVALGRLGWGTESPEEAAKERLRAANANWKKAENTIPAREYWEKYFEKNPDQRPKHIIFYDGDPSTAIYEFQQKNNIGRADVSESEGNLLGFDDRHVADMRQDKRAWRGYDELVDTANKIIADHYRTAA